MAHKAPNEVYEFLMPIIITVVILALIAGIALLVT